jgi:hypothetical protein
VLLEVVVLELEVDRALRMVQPEAAQHLAHLRLAADRLVLEIVVQFLLVELSQAIQW